MSSHTHKMSINTHTSKVASPRSQLEGGLYSDAMSAKRLAFLHFIVRFIGKNQDWKLGYGFIKPPKACGEESACSNPPR